MSKLTEVKWGIIGCGDVTEVKSGPAFNKIEKSKLVAVMRRTAKKAEDYAKRHNVPRYYSDADELINDPDVNAVYVATPPDSHKEYTIKALRAGKPVYCEKPMALNYNECMEMIKVSEETGVPLYVAYYRRGLEEFNKVRDLIKIGKIGTVRCVNVKLYQATKPEDERTEKPWRVNPEIAGGGYFVDLAPHQIDILQFILGDIESVTGVASNQAALYKAEDTVSASFKFESGVLGTGLWNFNVAEVSKVDEIEIVGTSGTIYFSCFDSVPIEMVTHKGGEVFQFERPKHIQQPFIKTVVEDLLDEGPCHADLNQASKTNWFIDQVLNNYYR